MPELPEVETIRRGIKSCIIGETILSVIIRNQYLRWPVSNEIYTICNETIIGVHRRAKYLLLKLTNGWIIIHLGMSGNLRIYTKEILPKKHDHIDLIISNGKILRYTDPRRFGAWLWTKELNKHNILKNLGPEPLSKQFNAKYLRKKCVQKKVAIKPWIMNTKLVVGVGNIYANESLFDAKINPNRLAFSLSHEESTRLVESIKKVLENSIKHGGTTLKNFLQSDGMPGYFTQRLKVYGRKGELCLICGTLITLDRHAQRVTFYCHKCQK